MYDVLVINVIHAQWFYIIDCSISIALKLCSEKGHEQVEKTLEMKKME